MNMAELSDHQGMMVETARRIGEKFGLDYWAEKDRNHAFPGEMWKAICDAGLCGVALPEEHGGAGLGVADLVLVVEALVEGGAGPTLGQVFMLNPVFGGVALSRYANPAMRAELLPKIISGEINCCMALTEPDAGSNTLHLRSFAREVDDGWILDGRKIWITGVPDAQKMLAIARTLPADASARRTDGITMFLIDVDREGLTHQPIEKAGTHTLTSSMVFFDGVKIREDELVGTLHKGWHELLDVLNNERIITTASLVGAGRLAARLGIRYGLDRKVFDDRPVASYQGLQFPLARAMATLECASAMNLRAAALCDAGKPYGSESNMAKLVAAEAAEAAIDRAMQMMGGMGFSREFHVERLWRDARLFKFAPVSEEMILNYIAVHDLGMPRGY